MPHACICGMKCMEVPWSVTCRLSEPFPQGRVTDHRVGVTEHGIEGVMDGSRLHVFVDALHAQHQEVQLEMLDV